MPKSRKYLEEMQKFVHVKNSIDKGKLEALHQENSKMHKSRNTLFWMRILVYVLLYASILSSVTIILGIETALTNFYEVVFISVSTIGVVLSVILVVVLSQSIDTYDKDIKLIEAHMIAIYAKNDKSSAEAFREFLTKI